MNDETPSRAKLLDNSPTSLTTDNIPVATDVYLRHLEPFALQSLRRATEEGLVPSSLDFGGDDGSIAIIRFTRLRAG
jgi:hypothetical protein